MYACGQSIVLTDAPAVTTESATLRPAWQPIEKMSRFVREELDATRSFVLKSGGLFGPVALSGGWKR